MDTTIVRCPVCLNRHWHARAGTRECTHCGLQIEIGADTCGIRQEIADLLASGRIETAQSPARRWRLRNGARRNAAWALGFTLDGDIATPATPRPHAVTLGIIARPGDLDTIGSLASGFARVVAVLDGDGNGQPTQPRPGLHLATRPLDGDYAAQRNQVQALSHALAPTGWVLQLDTDERPTDHLLDALGWLTEAAGRDGLRSLGLPRRNLVDGVRSSLYPDIQYRLNRSDVRFEGRVHERPSVPFHQTSLALAGDIEHHLSRARVLARSLHYEALRPGAGRPDDERALLQPFTPEDTATR